MLESSINLPNPLNTKCFIRAINFDNSITPPIHPQKTPYLKYRTKLTSAGVYNLQKMSITFIRPLNNTKFLKNLTPSSRSSPSIGVLRVTNIIVMDTLT